LLFAVIGAIVLVAVSLHSGEATPAGEAAPAVASILLEKIPPPFQLRARPVYLQRLASHEMEEKGRALAEENEKLASLSESETGKHGASEMAIKENSSGKRFMAYVYGSINRPRAREAANDVEQEVNTLQASLFFPEYLVLSVAFTT
jgi:hypothetical protein